MARHVELRDTVVAALGHGCTLRKEDIGSDARLSQRGVSFTTESWEIEGLGHLCVMGMKAFFSLMRMETVVIAPTRVDLPLFNLDWVGAFGREAQIVELYDVQLNPWPEGWQAEFDRLREQVADLPDAPGGEPHWYDDILYPCSIHKRGTGLTERFSRAAEDYLAAYIAQLLEAPACDASRKESNVRAFAERLFAEGGPAVDQVTKLFGEQTARRLVVQHMYGVNE